MWLSSLHAPAPSATRGTSGLESFPQYRRYPCRPTNTDARSAARSSSMSNMSPSTPPRVSSPKLLLYAARSAAASLLSTTLPSSSPKRRGRAEHRARGRADKGRPASSDRRRAPDFDELLATAEAFAMAQPPGEPCTQHRCAVPRLRPSADRVATSATGGVDPECPVPMRFGALREGPLLAALCLRAAAT